MKLMQAFLVLQSSGKSPEGMNYLAFGADKGGAPKGTLELAVDTDE